ncbi:MAG: TlpA disulfide reductase family protein [Armatimonadota bacterium]|nr:TlpA disulfide reductase family protein [Armatimonadota bacterium]
MVSFFPREYLGITKWMLLVSAPNYLPVREILQVSAVRGKTYTVRLKRGRPLEIILRNETGKPLPEPVNLAVFRLSPDEVEMFDYIETRFRITKELSIETLGFEIHSQFGLESLGEGRYRCSIPENHKEPLLVVVHHPGFLRGFYTRVEPEALQQGRVEVHLPKPCTLAIEADVSRAPEDAYHFTVRVEHIIDSGSGYTPFFYTLFETRVAKQQAITLGDISPGEYRVELRGEPKMLGIDKRTQQPKFAAEWFSKSVRCKATIAGETHRIQLAFTPPDPSQYRGDKQLTITVTMPDGKPAANQPYKLTVHGQRKLTVLEGTLDAEGRTTLTQLKERVHYDLYVANREEPAGYIYLGDPDYSQPTSFRVPPSKGDVAPDITLYAVEGNATKSLSDYKGKWVYIDFWATWCGPCRFALEKLKAELPFLKQRYKDSLVVITVSIDDTPEPVKPYLQKIGLWGQCENFWAGAGGWQSSVGQAFGLRDIPTAVVINPQGVIVWRGHPMTLSLGAVISEPSPSHP